MQGSGFRNRFLHRVMATTALDLARITLMETTFLECAIVQPGPDYTARSRFANINLSVETEFSFTLESNYLSVRLNLRVQPIDADGLHLPVEGRFHTHFGFMVENLEELLDTASDQAEPMPSFMLTLSLLSVAYSTSRGMILGKVAGTVFEGYCLPLMDARELLALAADKTNLHQEPAEALTKVRRALAAKAEAVSKPAIKSRKPRKKSE